MSAVKPKQQQLPCQGVSRWDEPCDLVGSRFCERCDRWFCEAHFGDTDWHTCAPQPAGVVSRSRS